MFWVIDHYNNEPTEYQSQPQQRPQQRSQQRAHKSYIYYKLNFEKIKKGCDDLWFGDTRVETNVTPRNMVIDESEPFYPIKETVEDIQNQVNEFRKVQNVMNEKLPIVYETDDHAQFFEVWRMDRKPRSYRDFDGHLRDTISTDVNVDTQQKATSATFDDKLKPNKKYYYCVRSIDNHGHISYPTPIYEVEMVDDKGSIFPLVKTVEFAEKVPRQSGRGMKRYMHIVPAMAQTLVNEHKSGLDGADSAIGETPILGLPDETIWGKKFKIRLTSKSTGKKIDLNLQFAHKHIKDKEG